MRSRSAALLLAALTPLAAACGGDGSTDATAAWQTVTDTVGDTTVVRTVGAVDSAALLRLVPELRIGELEGAEEYQFGSVGDVLPAPGGGAYVWDDMATELRQYDSAGAFVRRIGRKGAGPGEYEGSNGMALLPDGRLALWDPRNARVVVYDTTGAVAGGWHVTGGFFTQRAVGTDTAGTVALFTMLDAHDPANPAAERRRGYVRYATDGTVVDSLLAPMPPDEAARLTAVRRRPDGRPGGSSATTVPFTPQVSCARGPHGDFACGRGDRYAITIHRPGAPLRIERDVPRVPVQADERASEEEVITAMLRNTDPSWRWTGPAVPDEKPYFRAIERDADGRVWVRRSMPGERIPDEELAEPAAPRPGAPPMPRRRWRERTAYDVFAPDGRFLGHLPMPPRTTLHHRRGDTVWGVQRDSLDVESVVRFRVDPSLAARAAARP